MIQPLLSAGVPCWEQLIRAMFWMVPVTPTLIFTWSWTCTLAPAARLPRFQVHAPLEICPPPVADTGVQPDGIGSVSTTFVAAPTPLFFAVRVKVARPPGAAADTSTLFVSERLGRRPRLI